MEKISEATFLKLVPAANINKDCEASDIKPLLEMHCFGLAKNLISCVPEKGHLPTSSFTLSGSASLVIFPLMEVLSFFAVEAMDPKIKLADVVPRLLQMNGEKFENLLLKVKTAGGNVFHGMAGPGDLLFTPPGWVAVVSTGAADVIGLKLRFIMPALTDSMKALHAKLREHDSASPLLASLLQPQASA